MKPTKSALDFIDLSFLSAEEEAAIRQVLLRDEDLKRLETGRVRKLRQSVPDLSQLKTLTGEWFEELSAKRYGQRTDVTAVVRSSMRWKKTAAHKFNPFLKNVEEEKKEDENGTCTAPPNASADPRLIHPALTKENYHQYTDEDFMDDGPADKSSLEKLKASNGHKPTFNNTDPKAQPKSSLEKISDLRPAPNDTEPRNNSTETQPKDFSGDRTTGGVQWSSAVQMQPETKSERSATKDATNAERRRKISLPPALKKDQSFEENWVKISLEANPVKPIQDESTTVEPKLKDVNTHGENAKAPMMKDISDLKKVDGINVDFESSSLNSADQITLKMVSEKIPPVKPKRFIQDVSSERSNISKLLGSKEVTYSANASKGSTDGNQQNLIKFIHSESETDKAVFSNSASSGEVVSRDEANDKASLDRKGGERKYVNTAMLAKADTDQLSKHVSGEKHMDGYSNTGKWEIKMESHKIPSDPTHQKDDFQQVETRKKETSNIHTELLPNQKTTVNAVQPHASVLKEDDACEDREKVKSSSDLNLQQLSKHHLSMTDDGKLAHGGNVNTKFTKNPSYEEKDQIQPTDDKHRPSDVLGKLSKDHLSMTDDGKLVHTGGDVTLHVGFKQNDNAAFKPVHPPNTYKSSSEDIVGPLSVAEPTRGSSEMKDLEGYKDTNQSKESSILLNVLARAQKTRPPVLPKITAEDRDNKLPTIVILPSESPGAKEMEGNRHEAFVLEASGEGSKMPSYTADAWEDEGVNSDDDSSLSSYGSDLSSKKGHSSGGLSVNRTGSLMSVYSEAGDFGNVHVQGSVEFAMMYSPIGELIIMIEQCQDLAIANIRKQRTDPYVKTYLYPDKLHRSKRKTSIKKRTTSPVYVESLRYNVTREELSGKTLNLSVWHNDSRGRNVFLGQVEIDLKTWDWEQQALTWYTLQPKTSDNPDSQQSHGSLSVSLKYVPPEPKGGSNNSSGEIHVWLREAKELRRLKPQGVDSFVKCYILPDTRKKSRQKTRVIKKTQDPVYNHTMVYDGFKAGEVIEACCELTVWDHNALSNTFLGGVRLSLGTGLSYGKKVDWMDSMNEEIQIWKRMLANPNSWVEEELPLRSTMTPRK